MNINVPNGANLSTQNYGNAGDVIEFAANGSYSLGANLSWPTGRTYVGNGATINGSNVTLTIGNSTDVSKFTFNGHSLATPNAGSVNFHGNYCNNVPAFNVGGVHDSKFQYNDFTGSSCGIDGTNGIGDNNVFSHNWGNVVELIHLGNGSAGENVNFTNNTDVSYNVNLNGHRNSLEIQFKANGLTVQHNYITQTFQHGGASATGYIAISCATGDAQNVDIGWNTLINNDAQGVDAFDSAAIEIMGNQNIKVHDNYAYNWGGFLLNGVGGNALTSSNNVGVGITNQYSNDGVQSAITPINIQNDKFYAANDPSAPPVPPVPTWAGVAAEGATTVTQPAAPTGFTVKPASDGLHCSWTAVPNATSYTITAAAHGDPAVAAAPVTVPGSSTSCVIADKAIYFANWVIDLSISAIVGGVVSASTPSVSAQLPATLGPVTPPPPPPAPAPTLVHTVQVFSDGSVKVV